MLSIDERSNKALTVPSQATLDQLVAKVRDAHAGVISAFATAVEKALVAGQALLEAEDRKLIPQGQKGHFYKRCGLGDRQAERYKKLARLVAANPTYKSEMTGLSIEEAIKRASPPRAQAQGSKGHRLPQKQVNLPVSVKTTHVDILASWIGAAPEEQTKALNSIGFEPLLAAIPPDWLPVIERRLADRRQIPAPPITATLPADLSLPEFLQRAPSGLTEDIAADTDSEAEVIDEPDPKEDEPEPKAKHVKSVDYKSTIAEAVEQALADLSELASEAREIVDNAPEGLQQTERIQTFKASADELENLEAPDVPDVLGKIQLKYALPKRRYLSRQSRVTDASTILESCMKTLNEIAEQDENRAAAQELTSELESVIDAASNCEFPGQYG